MDKMDIRELAAETDTETLIEAEWAEQDAQAKAENKDISDFINDHFIFTHI